MCFSLTIKLEKSISDDTVCVGDVTCMHSLEPSKHQFSKRDFRGIGISLRGDISVPSPIQYVQTNALGIFGELVRHRPASEAV
jgi:hypothetical protein